MTGLKATRGAVDGKAGGVLLVFYIHIMCANSDSSLHFVTFWHARSMFPHIIGAFFYVYGLLLSPAAETAATCEQWVGKAGVNPNALSRGIPYAK